MVYDGQVRKFGTLRTSFNKDISQFHDVQGYRVPKWEDDEIWKGIYQRPGGNKISIGDGNSGETIKFLSNPEELRDICYEMISKEKTRGYAGCNTSSGWCEACLMGEGWYGTSKSY